jgi:hypothetical protein
VIRRSMLAGSLLLLVAAGCATFGALASLQPPTVAASEEREAELRLLFPSLDRPLGGASVRLWARVTNPNTFGLTLARLDGSFFLEDIEAAQLDLPLGLPLRAAADTIIPIDLNLSFREIPRLAEALFGGLERAHVDYRLDGRMAVEAGPLGQPSFGPMTLLDGAVRIVR